MENINNIEQNPNPNPPAKKSNFYLALSLILIIVIALIFLAVNFYSSWECVNGQWVKKGFPLNGKPKNGCIASSSSKYENNGAKSLDNISIESEKKLAKAQILVENSLEVFAPQSGESIGSPLKISGRVKGGWFFEGSFPVKLADAKGNIFAESYASSVNGDWMNEGWIEFSATINYPEPFSQDGLIIFEKDNPSGIDAYDFSVSLPIKFGFTKEFSTEKSPHIYSQCGHDPKDDPILGDCGEDCNNNTWKTYKNSKYGYLFKYDPSFQITKSCKHSNCIVEEQGGDVIVLTGDLAERGWPMIEIRHLQTDIYNPSSNFSGLAEWLMDKFTWTKECLPNSKNIYFTGKDGKLISGYNIYFPSSPQAYSRREIYYIYEGKIFQIIMLDVDEPQARQFYDNFLTTFKVVGEN